MSNRLRLGILTWRKGRATEELPFFTQMAREAARLDVHVCLFAPADVLSSGKIKALVYHPKGGWLDKVCAPPDLVYDRFRYMKQPAFHEFIQFRNRTTMPFLNSRLAHKWNLHRILQNHEQIKKWLPETLFLENSKAVFDLLRRYKQVYLKPVNGTGGKGILRVTFEGKTYKVSGRDATRTQIAKSFTSAELLGRFISKWTAGTKYIVQQGLNLEWEHGSITDFRLLVQKDGKGSWGITGLVGKIGQKKNVTSNLHSGGSAVDPIKFLKQYFSEEKCASLVSECDYIGITIAEYLEQKFGRLVELGIDLGIDKDGKLWMIEVNPKPGRDLFRHVGNFEAYRQAIRKPIEYAIYLMEKSAAR